ncbi:hypothetical protein QJQ45_011447 [Haematococcus lacustris]|nr:hypothetical protein QJQ45_011447 [Haematococcus lacustris]
MAKKKHKKDPGKKQKASRSPQGKQRQERRDGWTTRRRQVIKVPEGAVLRGCKKTRRKLREHLRLRAEIHSQLRSAPAQPASMECDTDSDSESDCDSEPEPQSDSESESEPEPVTQPPPRRCSARLAALAPAAPTGHPLPLDCEDPVMLRQLKDFCMFFANSTFEDPSNQALLAKLQELGNIHLAGDANTIGAHSMQLAVAMQQHYSNPGKAQLRWSGEEAQLFIMMACGYGINAKSSELKAATLDKGHVADLVEEANTHRRLLGMKKQGSLQDTLTLPCRMRHAVHVCRWLERWQQPHTLPAPGQPKRGKRRGVGPRTLTCPPPFTLTPMARVRVHFIKVNSRVLHGVCKQLGLTKETRAAFPSEPALSHHWARWFNTNKLRNKEFAFERLVDTDGVSVCVHYTRPLPPPPAPPPAASSSSTSRRPSAAVAAAHAVGLPHIGRGIAEMREFVFDPDTQIGVGIDPGVTQAVSAASGDAHGHAKQLVVFFGAASIGTGGGWGADAVLRACCKVVCRPRGAGQRRGRVVLVDEYRTTRVSSAVNGKQLCEEELDHEQPTRRAGWTPPARQVEQRLVRPAWSQQRDQSVRGLMWCPVVAPRKPQQAPCSSQAATQPAALEPGPSTPPPAKRSTRTGATARQRIGESRWRPLELCWWPDQGARPAKGKEYPGLGYKRLRDKPPKAQQQQQQQPAVAQTVVGGAPVRPGLDTPAPSTGRRRRDQSPPRANTATQRATKQKSDEHQPEQEHEEQQEELHEEQQQTQQHERQQRQESSVWGERKARLNEEWRKLIPIMRHSYIDASPALQQCHLDEGKLVQNHVQMKLDCAWEGHACCCLGPVPSSAMLEPYAKGPLPAEYSQDGVSMSVFANALDALHRPYSLYPVDSCQIVEQPEQPERQQRVELPLKPMRITAEVLMEAHCNWLRTTDRVALLANLLPDFQPTGGPFADCPCCAVSKLSSYSGVGQATTAIQPHLSSHLDCNGLEGDVQRRFKSGELSLNHLLGTTAGGPHDDDCATNLSCSRPEVSSRSGPVSVHGLVGFCCCHGVPALGLFCNMPTPEQFAFYLLALTAVMAFSCRVDFYIDFGCRLKITWARYVEAVGLPASWKDARIMVNWMHGASHNQRCQVQNNGRHQAGAGWRYGEQCEQLWSMLKDMAGVTRYMTLAHRASWSRHGRT